MPLIYTNVGHLSKLSTTDFRWEVNILRSRIVLDKHSFYGYSYKNSSGNKKNLMQVQNYNDKND